MVFILILFLRNKLSLTNGNQIHIRLQYTCWQMAQQFYFYIEFISFGRIYILFVRSKSIFYFATWNKYFICVRTADGPRRTSRAHLLGVNKHIYRCRSIIVPLGKQLCAN